MFAITVIAVLLIMALTLGWNNPRRLVALAVFFAPWSGLDADVGLRVTAYLLVTVALLLLAMARSMSKGLRRPHTPTWLWLVIGYAVLWSLVQIAFLPQAQVAGGVLRSPELRVFAQIIMFIIMLSPIFVIPAMLRKVEDLRRLARVYIVSVTILAAIGWMQILIWFVTGENPLPIGFIDSLLTDNEHLRSGIFTYQDATVYRMNSFGGEPKILGAGLAVGLMLVQAGARPSAAKSLILWIFLFASLIATFSTMGLLLWVGATIMQILITPTLELRLPKLLMSFKKSTVALVFLGAPLVTGGIYITGQEEKLTNILVARTVDRIKHREHGAIEDFNMAIIDFLRHHPSTIVTGVGLGNAHLYANSYLPLSAWHYADGTAFVAKSAALRWVSEIGVITLAIFLFGVYWSVKRAVRVLRRSDSTRAISRVCAKLSLPLVVVWLISGYVYPQFFIMVGVIRAVMGFPEHSVIRRSAKVAAIRPSEPGVRVSDYGELTRSKSSSE